MITCEKMGLSRIRDQAIQQNEEGGKGSLQDLAAALFDLPSTTTTSEIAFAAGTSAIVALFLNAHRGVDGKLKDLVDSAHFLAAAFDVCGAHSLRDRLALIGSHWSQALCLEEFDAIPLVSQI